ncbi:MAG: hypothetical protein ACFBSC_05970 [Microcoleaceae cyanobacterium]
MLIPVLIIDIALVTWSLRLMQRAAYYREFSFMLAGILVATAAAATMLVYFLMGSCVDHFAQHSQAYYSAVNF